MTHIDNEINDFLCSCYVLCFMQGDTPLHQATVYGDTNMMNTLVRLGANTSAQNNKVSFPFIYKKFRTYSYVSNNLILISFFISHYSLKFIRH